MGVCMPGRQTEDLRDQSSGNQGGKVGGLGGALADRSRPALPAGPAPPLFQVFISLWASLQVWWGPGGPGPVLALRLLQIMVSKHGAYTRE